MPIRAMFEYLIRKDIIIDIFNIANLFLRLQYLSIRLIGIGLDIVLSLPSVQYLPVTCVNRRRQGLTLRVALIAR